MKDRQTGKINATEFTNIGQAGVGGRAGVSKVMSSRQTSSGDSGRPSAISLDLYPIEDAACIRGYHRALMEGEGVPFIEQVFSALQRWNQYLRLGDARDLAVFLSVADSIVGQHRLVGDEVAVWPVLRPCPEYCAPGPWLSASVQGLAVSVLLRAHQITGDVRYFDLAERGVCAFERDILDGGVCAPALVAGNYFEDVAVYPAAHVLEGHILALLALRDFLTACGGKQAAGLGSLLDRGHETLHILLDAYDTGAWTRDDLLHRRLDSLRGHRHRLELLRRMAEGVGCDECRTVARRWDEYTSSLGYILRRLLAQGAERVRARGVLAARRTILGQRTARRQLIEERGSRTRVCIPITAFPIAGGMRSVVSGIARAMSGEWDVEFLTQHVGPDTSGFVVERFGPSLASPWQFPSVWMYTLSGFLRLLSLFRHGQGYHVILPQDGVFSGAFASMAAKVAGARTVCTDHGNTTTLVSPNFRRERLSRLMAKPLPIRVLARVLYKLYWPSLGVLARVTAHLTDIYVVGGEDVEDALQTTLHVHSTRIVRYPYTIDTEQYMPASNTLRATRRALYDLPVDALVVTMVCRLSPEKGIDIALRGFRRALDVLPPAQRPSIRLLIAGAGPLRSHIEAEIRRLDLNAQCELRGELQPPQVAELLSVSDVFFYTSTRGATRSVAILEAMSSGCAVVASTEPASNTDLLADGRGLAIPAGDDLVAANALVSALSDTDWRKEAGKQARAYVETFHSHEALRRAMRRAAFWPGPLTYSLDKEEEETQ